MSSEIGRQVQEAVSELPMDRLREAGWHIFTAGQIIKEVSAGTQAEDIELASDFVQEADESTGRAEHLLNKGSRDLSEYADQLDTGSIPPSDPPAATHEDTEKTSFFTRYFRGNTARASGSASAPVHYGVASISKKLLRATVDDIVQQQLAAGFDKPPLPPVSTTPVIEGRHLSDYEDGEMITMTPLPTAPPNAIVVDSLRDLRNGLEVVCDVMNGYYEPNALDELMAHESEHIDVDEVLVALYGLSKQGQSPHIRHALTITVTGQSANGYPSLDLSPATLFGNITIPAVALALGSAYPIKPSSGDIASIKMQGFHDRHDVLRRVEEYNQRPGVRQLPLPKQ